MCADLPHSRKSDPPLAQRGPQVLAEGAETQATAELLSSARATALLRFFLNSPQLGVRSTGTGAFVGLSAGAVQPCTLPWSFAGRLWPSSISAARFAAASPAVSPGAAALARSSPSQHPAVAAFRGARAAHSHRLALSCKIYRVGEPFPQASHWHQRVFLRLSRFAEASEHIFSPVYS